ncbi:MAG: helix-turn-helix domain-containing protein [Planctomycetes bacterium]|nr:helix-turn-helix domain-containing protein [Planctomycetota bacterium]
MRVKSAPKIDLNRYFKLMRKFPLLPINSEQELDAATEVLNALLDKGKYRTPEEDAYLHLLGDIIGDYEDVHYPIEPASDAGMLEFLIEQKPTTQAALAQKTGIAESTISAVLSGKRKLTREQVGKVASFFHVSPDVFSFKV